jgi:hypothetical protein
VVTECAPPRRKVWETVGTPRLLVIGPYRMGFEVSPEGAAGSRLRVFIDYALPTGAPARWLGRALGGAYARWCTHRMVRDAVSHFGAGAPVWSEAGVRQTRMGLRRRLKEPRGVRGGPAGGRADERAAPSGRVLRAPGRTGEVRSKGRESHAGA